MNGSEARTLRAITPPQPFPSSRRAAWHLLDEHQRRERRQREAERRDVLAEEIAADVRTISGAIIFGSPSLYKTSLTLVTIRKSRLWRAATCLALASRAPRAAGRARPREFAGERAFGYLQAADAVSAAGAEDAGHEPPAIGSSRTYAPRRHRPVQRFTHLTRRGATCTCGTFSPASAPPPRARAAARPRDTPRAPIRAPTSQQRLPVPGANDGASGVALLLGCRRAQGKAAHSASTSVVDGEDYGDFATDRTTC